MPPSHSVSVSWVPWSVFSRTCSGAEYLLTMVCVCLCVCLFVDSDFSWSYWHQMAHNTARATLIFWPHHHHDLQKWDSTRFGLMQIQTNCCHQNQRLAKFQKISIKMHCRRLLFYLWLLRKFSSDFKNSKTKMCCRSFWTTFIFLHPHTATITTKNEIKPDLAWYNFFSSNFLFKYLFTLFFKYFSLFLTASVPTRTKSHLNSKLFEPKCIVGDSKQHTIMSTCLSISVHLSLSG